MATKFKVSNTVRGTLSLRCVGYPVKAGDLFTVNDDQLKSDEISTCKNKEWIIPQENKKAIKQDTKIIVPVEKDNEIVAYDLENKELLTAKNSQKMALDRINSEKIEVQTSIDKEISLDKVTGKIKLFAKKGVAKTVSEKLKNVVKELVEENTVDAPTENKIKLTSKKKPISPDEVAKELILNTTKEEKEERHPLEDDSKIGEIGFVDIEQEKERIIKYKSKKIKK